MAKNLQKTGEADFKVGVFQEYFGKSRYTFRQEIDRIDFIITDNTGRHLIWAETKKNTADIVEMFVQLILTIGKGRTFDKYTPPPFLCVFDYHKIAFLQYHIVNDIIYQNDFNWNVAPSDKKSKEFNKIKNIVECEIEEKKLLFSFENDKMILKEFIRNNFSSNLDLFPDLVARLQIDKNNFIRTYNRWIEIVKPSIAIDWNKAKSKNIIDGDFYLADLLSQENVTLKEKLYVLLKKTNYELDKQIDDMGLFTSKTVEFNDGGRAHRHFWEIYVRPPKKEYWNYIIERRDLLVPQDIRERKGSFFTPQIWVNKSQEYIAEVFGENWQDEYYVWDCCAGTGNLLVGLTNKYNIWASTLDRQDLDVMKDRIKNGANLLEKHIFQFDFLNDSFDNLPKELKKIIDNPEKRKKLVIYINPPYAEAGNQKMILSDGDPKTGVSINNKTKEKYQQDIGSATNELSTQFMARIFHEIPNSNLALFSKLKFICAENFTRFRNFFTASYKAGFIVPANTFDNVQGNFPIAFTIWDLSGKNFPKKVTVNIPDSKIKKTYFVDDKNKSINHWIRSFNNNKNDCIGLLICETSDFQKVHQPYITLNSEKRISRQFYCNEKSLLLSCIYFSVRLCIEPTWINDRDQFLFPNDGYKNDKDFQNNCIIFTLFHGQNRVTANDGINHWIPFTAKELNAKENFQSDFMSNYLKNIKKLSKEARAALEAGKKLWKYYHSKIANHPTATNDASFYDIREFFQGRSENGNMKTKSDDTQYNELIKELRQNLSVLAEVIKPKVYEYGFLKK